LAWAASHASCAPGCVQSPHCRRPRKRAIQYSAASRPCTGEGTDEFPASLLRPQDSLLARGIFPVRSRKIPCSVAGNFARRLPICPGNTAPNPRGRAGFCKIPCYFPCSQGIWNLASGARTGRFHPYGLISHSSR
jgi:hypothetical protein